MTFVIDDDDSPVAPAHLRFVDRASTAPCDRVGERGGGDG